MWCCLERLSSPIIARGGAEEGGRGSEPNMTTCGWVGAREKKKANNVIGCVVPYSVETDRGLNVEQVTEIHRELSLAGGTVQETRNKGEYCIVSIVCTRGTTGQWCMHGTFRGWAAGKGALAPEKTYHIESELVNRVHR